MNPTFAEKYGPWALVTGASKGIGTEFARQLAALGLNIVLLASHGDALRAIAAELTRDYGVDTRVVTIDLGRVDVLEQVARRTDDIDVGLLVSNAATSTVGPFLAQSVDYVTYQLDVNARAALMLTHHFATRMAQRGSGGVILMSSGSALHGTPFSANYAGTKAYNLILAESLWYEMQPLGIDVLGFMAGATRTPGWQANRPRSLWSVPVMDAEPTVNWALWSLGRRPSVAAGRLNRFGYALMSLMTRARAVKLLGGSMKKMFGPLRQDGTQPFWG